MASSHDEKVTEIRFESMIFLLLKFSLVIIFIMTSGISSSYVKEGCNLPPPTPPQETLGCILDGFLPTQQRPMSSWRTFVHA